MLRCRHAGCSPPALRVATALAQGDTAHVAGALVEAVRAGLGGAAPAFVGLFASTAQPLDALAPQVAAAFPGAAVIGSSTAGEFTERGDAKSAASIFAVAGDLRAHAGMGVGLAADPERAVTQALAGLPLTVAGYPHRTAVLLLDPLAGNGEEATLLAASMLGEGVRLAGGAAGDDLAMRRTLVSAGALTRADAVVVAMLFSRAPLGVGVCHGHAPLSRPLRVTRAVGNVVFTIEDRPAWTVWLEETRAHVRAAGGDVDAMPPEAEGAYLLRYEAGLAAGGAEYKIRAPLSRGADGSIHFACGIAEGTVIRITESDAERQVQSAREAARRARARLGGPSPRPRRRARRGGRPRLRLHLPQPHPRGRLLPGRPRHVRGARWRAAGRLRDLRRDRARRGRHERLPQHDQRGARLPRGRARDVDVSAAGRGIGAGGGSDRGGAPRPHGRLGAERGGGDRHPPAALPRREQAQPRAGQAGARGSGARARHGGRHRPRRPLAQEHLPQRLRGRVLAPAPGELHPSPTTPPPPCASPRPSAFTR